MSKLKILFNYNDTEDKEPIELSEFVNDNYDDLYDMRCLYVLRANADKELVKFGIAGQDGGTGAYGTSAADRRTGGLFK